MKKKLMIVWLSSLMVLFSSISIYAEENVQGNFFEKHVVINGAEIINYNLQYPFLMYNDTTYFPLSPEMNEILGLKSEMDWESHTLKLLKTDSTRQNISSNWMKNNNVDLALDVLSEVKVFAFVPDKGEQEEEAETEDSVKTAEAAETTGKPETVGGKIMSLAIEALADLADNAEGDSAEALPEEDSIRAPELSVTELDLTGTPVLACGNYLFLPVRALAEAEGFDWDLYFDPYYGLCISTNGDVPAESYCDKAEVLRNKGLVKYIKGQNPGVSTTVAQQYVFLFQRAEDVYGVADSLLMAIASKESHFNTYAGSGGGARGMMQIMPGTAAGYGIAADSLYDAKTSIDFGAMYVGQRINAYGGDWTRGLSAYNQGSARVNRGAHSTVYADRVISEYHRIGNYLTVNGYIAQ